MGFEQTEMDPCLRQYLRGVEGEDDNEICVEKLSVFLPVKMMTGSPNTVEILERE